MLRVFVAIIAIALFADLLVGASHEWVSAFYVAGIIAGLRYVK